MPKLKKQEKKMAKQFPKTLVVFPGNGDKIMFGVSEEDVFDKIESKEDVVAKYQLVEVCRVKRRVDLKPVRTWDPPMTGADRPGPKIMPHVGPSQTKEKKALKGA